MLRRLGGLRGARPWKRLLSTQPASPTGTINYQVSARERRLLRKGLCSEASLLISLVLSRPFSSWLAVIHYRS